MNVIVFDIETIPDVAAGRRLLQLNNVTDEDVVEALRVTHNNNAFLPHYLHRIVAISVVWRHHDKLNVWSLGKEDSSEAELIQRFFDAIEKYTPTLVSWNGGGFDLPVLHYRTLLHGIVARRYWEWGEDDQSFRWNNYLNRFHMRHTDLMDVLANYQMRANTSLDNMATLLGYPGKMGMDGSQVFAAYQRGDIKAIRDYCETDVLNTYLIYLRFLWMRGQFSESQYVHEYDLVRHKLETSEEAHWHTFLAAMPDSVLPA